MKIRQGYLFEVVTDNFKDTGERDDYGDPKESTIPRGLILEIRYPYAWHFRTNKPYKNARSGDYGHAYEKEILENCKLIGQVNDCVRFENRESLNSILENKLYDKFENDKFENMPESSYLYLFEKNLNESLNRHRQDYCDLNVYLENSLDYLYYAVKKHNVESILLKFKELDDKYKTNFCKP